MHVVHVLEVSDPEWFHVLIFADKIEVQSFLHDICRLLTFPLYFSMPLPFLFKF